MNTVKITDFKISWKGIRSIVNTKKTNLINTSQIIINGKFIDNPKEVSKTFNICFANIDPNTEKNNSQFWKMSYIDFIIPHTSNEKLMNIILLLDENICSSPSTISVKLLEIHFVNYYIIR